MASLLSTDEQKKLKGLRNKAWLHPGKACRVQLGPWVCVLTFQLVGIGNEQRKRHWKLIIGTTGTASLVHRAENWPLVSEMSGVVGGPASPVKPFQALNADQFPLWEWYEELR